MTEEEIKKFAKEYVQNNTDESVNSFIGEQLQKAFIEGTDFMYYSNNEELKKELTEKDKQIAELKKIEEEYYDFIQKKNEEDWKDEVILDSDDENKDDEKSEGIRRKKKCLKE